MNKKNKAIFLDRDGVINDLVYHSEEGILDSPNSSKEFTLLPNVGISLQKLHNLGYKLIIVSNQPGIAKGKYTLQEFQKIKNKMEKELIHYKISFDGQYYCLHHPYAKIKKYKKNCNCRKPKTKLVLDAVHDFNIDLKKSFIIGDGLVDMELAKKLKCLGIFIGNINSLINKLFKEKRINPSYIAHDLSTATTYIKKTLPK